MNIKINGELISQVPTVETFNAMPTPSILANAQLGIKPVELDKVADKMIDIGQTTLIYTGSVVAVIVGIMIAVGLKREGWRRFLNIFEGLGVGLIGPTVVILVGGFCLGISNLISGS